jgi:hypothetical protein
VPKSRESAENLFAHNYKIAEPIAYPVFAVPGITAAATAMLREPIQPQQPGPYYETWYDTERDVEFGQQLKGAAPQQTERRALETKEVPREVRAIWITHGMGQQIPFETVDGLARGVLSVAQPAGVEPRLRTVKIGDQVLQRVELDVDGTEQDANGQPKRHYELHLYECYWAPKTEGVAKLSDTVSFLWDGALRGLLNSVHSFRRAMFGRMENFRVPRRTSIWISVTALVLVALTLINGVILAAAAARAKLAPLANLDIHWEQLAAIASSMIAVALTFGTVLFLAEMSKPRNLRQAVRLLVSILSWTALTITIVSILTTAVLMALTTRTVWTPNLLNSLPREQLQGFASLVILCCAVLVSVSMIWRGVLRSSARPLRGNLFLTLLFAGSFLLNLAAMAGPVWIWVFAEPLFSDVWPKAPTLLSNSVWVWPFLIALSAQIREIMVEYVGDVAIYVTPNKLDRFDDVRNKIKDTAHTVASGLYTACIPNTNKFLYDKIAIVGHSLGSVIAYDTLNRLMLEDWLSSNHLGIANRTKCMVTFGSPLNKTAFFFTIQGKDNLHIRERLAATVQPLIQSYRKFRKFKWINVFSRNDIISGPLEFYDLPGMLGLAPLPNVAVHNVVDRDAAVPLVAHVDYWKNRTVWNELLREIVP